MDGRKRDEDAPEAVNREQEDEGQAQDVAEDALRLERLGDSGGGSVRGNHVDPTQIIPDDVPDLVETMERMVSSGRIDNDAYAGEPQHDDEEDMLGDTEDDGDDELIFNELADGSEDPLADPVDLSDYADNGEDPLGEVASEHGLEDEDSDDDDDDYDDADDDDLMGDEEEE
jgi:hypothetical protein